MKNILFILLLSFVGCSKNSDTTPSTPTQNNTYNQDAILTGTWVADSSWDSAYAVTVANKGIPELGDSLILATSNPEISAWYITGASPVQLPSGYIWETSADSLYLKGLSHEYGNIIYRFGYSANALKLRTEMRQSFINGNVHRIGYYHKI